MIAMFPNYVIYVGFLLVAALTSVHGDCTDDYQFKFPKGFKFCVSSAAYQIEGAPKADGKGPSIWDNFTHEYPDRILDGSNGDTACNSYYLYPQDTQLIKNIGFDLYRLSISWSRILPNGDLSCINRKGIQHYHKVIDNLLTNGIQPIVAMYIRDLPQALQDKGGWLNSNISQYMTDYADVLFSEYGGKVKLWITVNQPGTIPQGYAGSSQAPGLGLGTPAFYIGFHNILRAHASIYRLYDRKYRSRQNGKISISLGTTFYFPADPRSKADRVAAERALQFTLGWGAHPIFSKNGDYPPVMRYVVGKKSYEEGVPSRLPYFTEKEKRDLRGAADFFALNHYSGMLATPGPSRPSPVGGFVNRDVNVIYSADPRWPSTASGLLKVVPKSFSGVLKWIKNRYNNPTVLVTENGYTGAGNVSDVLNDQDRISFHRQYLREMLIAINKYGCNVIGYGATSLLDSFEWGAGYTIQYGLTYVDRRRADKRRTPKASSRFFKQIIKSRRLS